jgi:hypothetical protein
MIGSHFPEGFEDTLDEMNAEIMDKYFEPFEPDNQFPCWKVNPFLWSLYCAATDTELTPPPNDQSLTEYDCILYFTRGFAVARLMSVMMEKDNSNVQ